MIKTTILCAALILNIGGCKMAQAVSDATLTNSDQTIEAMIREHAQKNLSLNSADIEMSELKPKDLPAGMRQFYVEQKNTSGKIRYTYLYWNNQLYSSAIKSDFGRFLKDYEFLQKKNADADQLMAFYAKLNNIRNIFPIRAEDLSLPSAALKPFVNKISTPKIATTTDGGATLTFYTQTMNVVPVQKVEVKIAPDYFVSVGSSNVSAD